MKLNIKGLKDGVTHLRETAPPHALSANDPSQKLVAPVEIQAKITKMGDDVLAQAELSTRVEHECSRCLTKMATPLETSLEILYMPARRSYAEARTTIPSQGDRAVSFYEEDMIDMTDDIAESITMALSMKPLCRPECRGICAHCGQNLNEGPCGCGESAEPSQNPFGDFFRAPPT